MKKNFYSIFSLLALLLSAGVLSAQDRYMDEVFNDADIIKQSNVLYGINVDFLKNQQLYDPDYVQANLAQIQTEHNEIRDSILSGIAAGTAPNIPSKYFQTYATDPSTEIKLITPFEDDPGNGVFNPFHMGMMDIYMPNPAVDSESQRPVMIYIHTGNFLPKGINGSVSGSKDDSVAVEFCMRWAKKGYVAIAANYRLGWNPLATSQSDRTRTLLNGVYRAIVDIRQVVRTVKAQAASFEVDPTKIALFGQGSGGYVTLAYNFLDKHSETTLPKFDPDATGKTVIDTVLVGNVGSGLGGLLNFYQYQTLSSISPEVSMVANAGGALGDKSWIEGGEKAVVSFHSLRDEFAPFQTGTVIVPTTQSAVVDADGPNVFMEIVNQNGLNNSFSSVSSWGDPYWENARSMYGKTVSSDLPIINGPNDITINQNAEGLYTFLSPLGFSDPWVWWDDTEFTAYHGYLTQLGFGPPLLAAASDIITGADAGNVNDKANSMLYVDTIMGYLDTKLMLEMELGNWQTISTEDIDTKDSQISVYPNPTSNFITVESNDADRLREINIVDITGRTVLSTTNVSNYIERIDLSEYPKGIYLLKIKSEKSEKVSKVILE